LDFLFFGNISQSFFTDAGCIGGRGEEGKRRRGEEGRRRGGGEEERRGRGEGKRGRGEGGKVRDVFVLKARG
jgi:hypothetical protein